MTRHLNKTNQGLIDKFGIHIQKSRSWRDFSSSVKISIVVNHVPKNEGKFSILMKIAQKTDFQSTPIL